ncbi:MAG TPA: CDGSH iron-sulfur domain-containing protein [Gemmatimonadales bacterium]|jgi:CDGSH-type Zn-finger protein
MSEPISIIWKKRGTVVVEGPVIVRDEDGNETPIPIFKQPGVVKFCGCGRSKARPFCDGSHKLAEKAEG